MSFTYIDFRILSAYILYTYRVAANMCKVDVIMSPISNDMGLSNFGDVSPDVTMHYW
jgi:hypothetical protein